MTSIFFSCLFSYHLKIYKVLSLSNFIWIKHCRSQITICRFSTGLAFYSNNKLHDSALHTHSFSYFHCENNYSVIMFISYNRCDSTLFKPHNLFNPPCTLQSSNSPNQLSALPVSLTSTISNPPLLVRGCLFPLGLPQ